MNLYISDLHFGHRNCINFDHRPFLDAGEMDYALMQFWNSRVDKDDNVYILGDFAYRNEKTADWYLRQLKGHKHLVIGNHDGETLKNEKAMAYFESVDKMMHVTDGDKQICLCHFPIAEWNGYHRGAWHIHGHIHGRRNETYEFMKTKPRALNAGCMINNYTPATINELIRNNRIFREAEKDRVYFLSDEERETLAWFMKHFDYDEIYVLVDAETAKQEFGVVEDNLPKGHFFITVDEGKMCSLTEGLRHMWGITSEDLKDYGFSGKMVEMLLKKFLPEME